MKSVHLPKSVRQSQNKMIYGLSEVYSSQLDGTWLLLKNSVEIILRLHYSEEVRQILTHYQHRFDRLRGAERALFHPCDREAGLRMRERLLRQYAQLEDDLLASIGSVIDLSNQEYAQLIEKAEERKTLRYTLYRELRLYIDQGHFLVLSVKKSLRLEDRVAVSNATADTVTYFEKACAQLSSLP